MTREDLEKMVLSKLSLPLAESIRNAVPWFREIPEEIHIRLNKAVVLTVAGKNRVLSRICTEEDMQRSLQLLCDHSLYSQIETIREGFISTSDGLRIGVCGRAVVENGKVTVVRDISSLCIRLPHRYPDSVAEIYEVLAGNSFRDSILVYAAPGKGKTTVLRELALRLANPPKPNRVVVIDTRYELGSILAEAQMMDVLAGYPRNTGMEIALRTMAPEYIVCDELASEEDRLALLRCAGCGVRLCASVHAGSLAELRHKTVLKDIGHLFQWYYGLDEEHRGTLIAADEVIYGTSC